MSQEDFEGYMQPEEHWSSECHRLRTIWIHYLHNKVSIGLEEAKREAERGKHTGVAVLTPYFGWIGSKRV